MLLKYLHLCRLCRHLSNYTIYHHLKACWGVEMRSSRQAPRWGMQQRHSRWTNTLTLPIRCRGIARTGYRQRSMPYRASSSIMVQAIKQKDSTQTSAGDWEAAGAVLLLIPNRCKGCRCFGKIEGKWPMEYGFSARCRTRCRIEMNTGMKNPYKCLICKDFLLAPYAEFDTN